MYITICDVNEDAKVDIDYIDGVIVREYDGLMDVQFTSDKFRLHIRGGYVKIRNKETHKSFVLADEQFSEIHIN